MAISCTHSDYIDAASGPMALLVDILYRVRDWSRRAARCPWTNGALCLYFVQWHSEQGQHAALP